MGIFWGEERRHGDVMMVVMMVIEMVMMVVLVVVEAIMNDGGDNGDATMRP